MPSSQSPIRFRHGLGDCANFAHVVELYRRHGFDIRIDTQDDKAPCFIVAGARIEFANSVHHPWAYPGCLPPANEWGNPSKFEAARPGQAWRVNKSGHNLNVAPLPTLPITPQEAWRELCGIRLSLRSQYDTKWKAAISRAFDSLPRPIVLMHSHGNTGPEQKSFTADRALPIYHAVLDRLGAVGSIVLLDWDNRLPRIPSYRVRHIADDSIPADVPALAYMIEQADLFVGVDSGPLHLCRFTDTPAIGIWRTMHPCFYTLPRAQTVNLMTNRFHEWDRWTRVEFGTVASQHGEPTADEIASLVYALAVEKKRPIDVQWESFLRRTRSTGSNLTSYVDRNVSFGLAADHLRQVGLTRDPVMVETGCARGVEDWGGAGYSTYLFACLFRAIGRGKLQSVELNHRNAEFARTNCYEVAEWVEVHEAHSHDWLAAPNRQPMDVFYSDSLDTDFPGHEESCLREVKLAAPLVRDDGLILIDDTVHQQGKWRGKGATAVPWLLANGFRILYSGYQCLLARI